MIDKKKMFDTIKMENGGEYVLSKLNNVTLTEALDIDKQKENFSVRKEVHMVNSAREIWETVKGELKLQVNRPNYRTWIEGTVGLSYENDRFIVGAPSTFVVEYLSRKQSLLIKRVLIGHTSPDVQVQFQVIGCDAANVVFQAKPNDLFAASVVSIFNPAYTFEGFIEGRNNRLALAAAMTVVDKPGQAAYNPLFIYAHPGLGKTHLLHAIGHAFDAKHQQVVLVSAEQFINEFVTAIREHKTEEFRRKFRGAGALLVDDIQDIAGKVQTQESFLHIFSELYDTKRQIVITSNQPPNSIPQLEYRLSSRFVWGLIVDIQPPNLETRLAILQAKARQQQVNLDPQILDFIGKQIAKNVREMEGLLHQVLAYAELLRIPLSLKTAEESLHASQDTASASTQQLLEAVASVFQITLDDLLRSKKRTKEIVLPRQVAMWLLRGQNVCTLTQIGGLFGNRNASAVTYACREIPVKLDKSPVLAHKVQKIRKMVCE